MSCASWEVLRGALAEAACEPEGRLGAVTSLQTFGSFGANFHPHLHAIVTEGVFTPDGSYAFFGSLPRVLAADKGYWESSEKTAELVRKIPVVSIGKKGGRKEEETAREYSLGFRLGQCFRAGIEGSISFLKLILGMGRCLNKGFAHFDSTVGATVFTHNLFVLARAPG